MENDILVTYARLANDQQFLSMESNKERIEYILTFVKPLQEYREQIFDETNDYCGRHQKSLQKSVALRSEGRKHFAARDYESAISSFTEAILNAPFPSETGHCDELSLAYGSRAITLFHVKSFENSLFDANRSLELLPTVEMLFYKVFSLTSLKRFAESKQLVEEMIKRVNKNELNLKNRSFEELLELKRLINRQLTINGEEIEVMEQTEQSINFWLNPSFEIEWSPKNGRYAIAKTFIPVNTTLLIEKPLSVTLMDEYRTSYCNNCFKNIGRQLWPCHACNELVFCDQHCSQEAWDQFHKYECGFTGLVFELSSSSLAVFRNFAKIGCANAFRFEHSVARNGFDIYDLIEDKNYKTESERIASYKAMTTLLHHNEDNDKFANILHTFIAIKAAILLNYSNLLDIDIVYDFELFVNFTDIVLLNVRRMLTNVFGWFQNSNQSPNNESEDRNHVANCLCVVASLTNHSCFPNTYWQFIDGKIVYTAFKDIEEGEEINITYGPIIGQPFDKRQKELKDHYYFTCNCIACLEDVKTVPALQCLQCDGPVVYAFNSQIGSCFQCGKDYENIGRSIVKVECNRTLFHQMINNIRNDINIDESISMAEKSLEALIQLLYHKNYEMLDEIKELLNVYFRFHRISDALKFSKHFVPSILAMRSTSGLGELLEDMLFWSYIYFEHLKNEKVIDKKEWNTGFRLYSRLIGSLKAFKKRVKYEKKITDENKTKAVKKFIKIKKEELKSLKRVYAKIETI